MHRSLFDVVACERLCIPFDVNKMVDEEEPFFGLLSVTTLEQWGLDESDIAEVTFAYQNFIFANFQPDPYSHLAAYRLHLNKYINTTSSISIKLLLLCYYYYCCYVICNCYSL